MKAVFTLVALAGFAVAALASASVEERSELKVNGSEELAKRQEGGVDMVKRAHRHHRGHSRRKHHKSSKAAASSGSSSSSGGGDGFKSIITWYTGHDLLNPSCMNGGWNPTDSSMIAAVTENGWSSKPACGSMLEVCRSDESKCIHVRVVDSCAGCSAGSRHVDLTTGAFKQLYDLDVGEVDDAIVRVLGDSVPGGSPLNLYGPINL